LPIEKNKTPSYDLQNDRKYKLRNRFLNLIKQNLDCNYTFAIDLVPKGTAPSGAKPIGEVSNYNPNSV